MLKKAKHVPSTYVPPTWDVGGRLLVEKYKDYIATTSKKVLIDAGYLD